MFHFSDILIKFLVFQKESSISESPVSHIPLPGIWEVLTHVSRCISLLLHHVSFKLGGTMIRINASAILSIAYQETVRFQPQIHSINYNNKDRDGHKSVTTIHLKLTGM